MHACGTAPCRQRTHPCNTSPNPTNQTPPVLSHIAAVPQSVATFTLQNIQHHLDSLAAASTPNQPMAQHSTAQHADQQCLHSTPTRPSFAQIVQVCKCAHYIRLSAGPTDYRLVTAFQSIFPAAAFVQAGLRVMHSDQCATRCACVCRCAVDCSNSLTSLECSNSLTSHQQNVQETQHQCCKGPSATATGTRTTQYMPSQQNGADRSAGRQPIHRVSGKTLARPAPSPTGCACQPFCIKHTHVHISS